MCPSNGIKNNTYYLPWDRCPDCGTLQCGWAGSEGIQYCPGAANSGNCYPYILWSSTDRDAGYYSVLWLGNGTFKAAGACDDTGRCINTNAFAVRCVLDMNAQGCKEDSTCTKLNMILML